MRALPRHGVVALLLAAWLPGPSAQAHEFWIEPSSHRPAAGEAVQVGLRVGDLPEFEKVPRRADRIEKFFVAGPGGEAPIAGADGHDPAGSFQPREPGLYVVAYRSRPSRIELEPEKFESYLREAGLERVIEERSARGESARPGREIYSRCAKSLVVAGGAATEHADRELGLRLELVARRLPRTATGPGAMGLQLLYEGKPCSGALVKAWGPDRRAKPLTARSAADGTVNLPVEGAGTWVVAAVHMVAAPEGADAEWESLWASLTLELPAPMAPPRPRAVE
jgi:uncharacterized GH25 family protein